jgi:hypothetical protein
MPRSVRPAGDADDDYGIVPEVPARPPHVPEKGRGATFNPRNRFRRDEREPVDDGWAPAPADDAEGDDAPPPLRTTVTIQHARTIIARNDSPDIPFTQSINPYQGCEHEIRTRRTWGFTGKAGA